MNTIWFPDLKAATGPKYKTLSDAIRRGIIAGQLQEGEQLPPVREIAWELKVTPGTIARAYSVLVEAGVLDAVVGRGTFVAAQKTLSHIPDWPDVVDLRSPKLPDVGQSEVVRRALRKISHMSTPLLQMYPTASTDLSAREAVMKLCEHKVLGGLSVEDVILSHGGQNAISLIFQTVLHGEAPVVLCEDLSYSGFRHAARLMRAQIIGLASDEEGIIPEAFEAACRTHKPQLLCTSPEVLSPTTLRTGLERRKRLVQIARTYDVQVLEDDCYAMIDSGLPSYRALMPERGWYISSISKLLTPALRIGYVFAPVGQGRELRRTGQYSFYGIATPMTELTSELLNDPQLDELLNSVRTSVAKLVQILVNGLGAYDLYWREGVPFVWLSLPRGWRAGAFASACEKAGVLVRPADEFALLDGRAPHAVRVSINGQIAPECYEAAIARMREILDAPPRDIEV
ncbi:MAG: PLP-dependent aminotransferase family protein [Litoreibacter sp.]